MTDLHWSTDATSPIASHVVAAVLGFALTITLAWWRLARRYAIDDEPLSAARAARHSATQRRPRLSTQADSASTHRSDPPRGRRP